MNRDEQRASEQRSRKVAEAAREQGWQQPSFGKELFLGRLRLDLIHPHPRPTEEELRKGEAFLARLEAFLREAVDPLQIERDAKIPDEVVRGLGELGAFGVKIDQGHGGLGLSQVYYNRALGLAASAHSSIGVLLSAHQSIGVPEPVRLFGTEDQQRRFLPGVAKNQVSAFLLTEPDVGSDPARMRTTATPTADGSAYVLNGSKLWTTNGVIADMLVVMAVVPRSDGHRGGITAFVVDAHTPGITVTHRNQFMGLRGIENGVTVFEDVRVPAADRLGEEGRGLKIALQTLNTGRLSLPAICCAAAKWSLRIARQWCNERVQWGRPIGKHEAVAAKVAFIAGMAYGMESMLELASALADDKRNDIRIEAALTKLYASEMAWLVADELVQLRGGRGYETATSLAARGERPVGAEQLLRDLDVVRDWNPDIVVLDEAQRIKNWATKTALTVKQLDPPYRLVLTGTPMENRLDELASIVEWVDDLALEPKWRLVPWHTTPVDGGTEMGGVRNLDTLRRRLDPDAVHARTGCHLHPSYWPA